MGANIFLSVILGFTLQNHVPNAVQIPQVASPVATKQQHQTLENVKTLALATMMFGADNNDVMPKAKDTKDLYAKLNRYLKSSDSTKSLNPKSSILFNFALNGMKWSDVKLPSETVIYYESKQWPDGRRAVSFCDGHAKLINPKDWKKVSAAVKKGP